VIPEIAFATLDDCHTASDVVVVIDVCRAFTTAAYAFGAGAQRIYVTGAVEEALDLKRRIPGALAMGEVEGEYIPGFDFGNSPVELSGANLSGRVLIQRTSAGTQGIVRSTGARHLLAGSFAVASATIRAIQCREPRTVTFVVTGRHPNDPRYGDEDYACGAYMAALLRGETPNVQDYMTWKPGWLNAHHRALAVEPRRGLLLNDLKLCMTPDCFDFALPVTRQDGLLVMEKEHDPLP
jgi:2-phosphosulfolactate phosphatase